MTFDTTCLQNGIIEQFFINFVDHAAFVHKFIDNAKTTLETLALYGMKNFLG